MEEFDKEELLSLEILMQDPDTEIAEDVDRRLLEIGKPALDYIIRRQFLSGIYDSAGITIKRRIRDLHSKLILSELSKEVYAEYPDIANGLYLLTALAYPILTRDEFDAGYIRIVEELLKDVDDDRTAVENVEILNYVFFKRFGFECVKENARGGKSVLLNKMFELREGFPVSVAIAYFLVARCAGLPIYPIPTPTTGFSAAYLYKGATILAIDVGDRGKIFPVPSYLEAMRNMYPESKHSDEQLLVPGDDKMVLGIYIESLSSYFEYENKEALIKLYDKASKIVGQRKILGK